METHISRAETASQTAAGLFGSGFHCAEAVVKAVMAAAGEDAPEAVAHATAFGGGFGKSSEEACGALSGALIVIGHFFGRSAAGADWDLPAGMAAEIRTQFLADWESTRCRTLCHRFGPENQEARCREVVGRVAGTLFERLSDQRG